MYAFVRMPTCICTPFSLSVYLGGDLSWEPLENIPPIFHSTRRTKVRIGRLHENNEHGHHSKINKSAHIFASTAMDCKDCSGENEDGGRGTFQARKNQKRKIRGEIWQKTERGVEWLEREFARRKRMRRECCVLWPLEECEGGNDAAIKEIEEDRNQEKQHDQVATMLMTQHLDELAQEELYFRSGLRLLLFHQNLDEL